MFDFLVSKAYAMGPPPSGGSGQEVPFYAQPFFVMILIMAVFYFFLLYPQRKERKKHEERLKNIKVGDKIVTSGGVHGIVANASGDPVKVKIADNVKIDISRSAIVSIQSASSEEEDKSKEKK